MDSLGLSLKRIEIARKLYNKKHGESAWNKLTSMEQAEFYNKNLKKIDEIIFENI